MGLHVLTHFITPTPIPKEPRGLRTLREDRKKENQKEGWRGISVRRGVGQCIPGGHGPGHGKTGEMGQRYKGKLAKL